MSAIVPLTAFTPQDLAPFAVDGLPADLSACHMLFEVGRDDVHGVLKMLLQRVTLKEKGNMFGYDDEELNDEIWQACQNPSIFTRWTLDKGQSGGKHEAAIIAANKARSLPTWNAHFAIITSSTSQISHTKGAALDGIVGFEGSTNWSASGEGTFLPGMSKAGGAGYKAQNNTLLVFWDRLTVNRFELMLDREYASAHISGGALAGAPAA